MTTANFFPKTDRTILFDATPARMQSFFTAFFLSEFVPQQLIESVQHRADRPAIVYKPDGRALSVCVALRRKPVGGAKALGHEPYLLMGDITAPDLQPRHKMPDPVDTA